MVTEKVLLGSIEILICGLDIFFFKCLFFLLIQGKVFETTVIVQSSSIYILCFGIFRSSESHFSCATFLAVLTKLRVVLFWHNCIFLKLLLLALNNSNMAICVARLDRASTEQFLLNAISLFVYCCFVCSF